MPEFSIRVGLHTGLVLSGNIGSETKMKFGCLGEPMNVANRLEGLCKYYDVGVLISGASRDALPPSAGFFCRQLDYVQAKGWNEPTRVYELIGRDVRAAEAYLSEATAGQSAA